MRLVELSPQWESAYMDYADEWLASGERFIPAAADPREMTYAEILAYLALKKVTPPAPLMRATTFFLEDNGRLLGAVDVRYALNDHLLAFGGHIGYGVRPSARGHGCAEIMVRLTFPFLRTLGIKKALITCDRDNPASAKTIQRLGGVLENMVLEDRRKWVCRYWVEVGES